MSYCSKCGTKLEEDDIYCPNCGTKRADVNDNVKNNTNKNADIVFKTMVNTFINMFLKPVTTAKKFINQGRKDMVILLTAFAVIIQGLFGIWRMNQVFSNINNIIIKSINKIFEIIQLIYPSGSEDSVSSDDINQIITAVNSIKTRIKIPYGEIFLQNCAAVLIVLLTVFVLICLANTLFSREKPEVLKFYKTAVVTVLPALYFEFFSILFSYLSIVFGMILMVFGIMVSIICFVKVINESLEISENCTLFVTSFTAVVTFVVVSVFFQKVIPSTLSSIVSSIVNSVESLNL